MHRDDVPGISISHHYVEDIEILHHLNELLSSFCVTKILSF